MRKHVLYGILLYSEDVLLVGLLQIKMDTS